MTSRSVGATRVTRVGLAAGTVFSTVSAVVVFVALGLAPQGRADEPATGIVGAQRPTELVVALGLGDPALQAGAVRGSAVVLARGLEVDIARSLARRLGFSRVRFVYARRASRLVTATPPPWHLTIASIRPARGTSAVAADLSDPYLSTDQVIVIRRGLVPPPSNSSDLRRLIVCAVRGSDGIRALAGLVRPAVRPIEAPTDDRLFQLLRTGACDAGLVEAGRVRRLVAGRRSLVGPVIARIEFGDGYVVAVTRGGAIAVAEVDRALARMRADGTLHRLTRHWLGIDPSRLRLLR